MARLLSTVQTVDVVFQSEDLTHESQLSRRLRPFRRAREWMGFPLRGRSRSGRARTTRDPSYAAVASAISTRPFAKAASRPALKPTCFAARSRAVSLSGVSCSDPVRLSYARILMARPPPAPASVGAGGRTTASYPRLIPTARRPPWPGAIVRRACRPLSLRAGRRPRSDPQHSRPPPGHRSPSARDAPAHQPPAPPPPPPPSLPPSPSPLPPPSPPPPP